jgi:hypothetical protein
MQLETMRLFTNSFREFEDALRREGLLRLAGERYKADTRARSAMQMTEFIRGAMVPFYVDFLLRGPFDWIVNRLVWRSAKDREADKLKHTVRRGDIFLFYPSYYLGVGRCAEMLPRQLITQEFADMAAEMNAPHIGRMITYALRSPAPPRVLSAHSREHGNVLKLEGA